MQYAGLVLTAGQAKPGWGLGLASSLRWSEMADIQRSTHHRAGLGGTTGSLQSPPPPPLWCWTSPGRAELCWLLWWELASSVGSRVEEEGDQAVDSKPGGRVVLPRLSININNPSHPTPHHTTPHHTTTQWTLSEKQPSLQLAISLIYDTASSSPCSA